MEWWVLLPAFIRIIILLAASNSENESKTNVVRNRKRKKEVTMMFNFWKRSIVKAGIFQGNYIDARAFFALVFREVPCIAFVGDLDVSAALKQLRSQFAGDIVHIYQSNYFDHDDRKLTFATTIVVLANKRMIVFGFDYLELLHTSNDYDWCAEMAQIFAAHRKSAPVHTPVIGFSVTTAMN